MKYLVIGASGQLGRDICPRLVPADVVPLTRAQADLARPESLRAALEAHRPDVVINCAAYNFVDRAETEAEIAFAVNAIAVRNLAMACNDLGSTLVHFSTDYVFGLAENRRTPYTETEAPGPLSVYALSKLAGEYFARSYCRQHYVIRTCGLYGVWGSGGKGGNFVETMLRAASQGKQLRVVADQVCTPSYTVDVAAAAVALVQTGKHGLYHLTNSGSCSWYDFAARIFDLAGIQAELSPITSKEYGALARRPPYSVLSCQAYETLGCTPLRSWNDALAAYLQERREREA